MGTFSRPGAIASLAMKIAILSDTHSKQSTIRAALAEAARRQVELILHCGDIADDETVRLFPAHTMFVFGNCDYARDEIEAAVAEIGATLQQPFGHLERDGKQIAFVHGDDSQLLRDLEPSDAFDFLFYGHTHQAKEHRRGKTRVINPGALYRAAVKTFVVLEVQTGAIEKVVVV
jgi:putative phosphoesterase